MITRYLLPALAAAGLGFALLYVLVLSRQPLPVATPVSPPPATSAPAVIAGNGLIEASSENIRIGSHVAGIVASVAVVAGDDVAAGAPLLYLDDRRAQAALRLAEAELAAAQARHREAAAALADAEDNFQRIDRVAARGALSEASRQRAFFAREEAQARRNSTAADIARARAAVQQAAVHLEQHVILAPVAGQVLRVDIRPGEFAAAGPEAALLTIGQSRPLHLRVELDENDAWRFDPAGKATASLRGNSALQSDLTLVRVEPFIVPKRSLTGETTERVDTRVLQVVYRITNEKLPLFVGQLMDVFIAANAVPPERANPPTALPAAEQ